MKQNLSDNEVLKQRVALYLRLSKEDIDKNGKESISESIKNQELMLRDEVKKHPDWEITSIYSDEDFSGAGTYRPNFEKMIASCKNGDIDIVLCKSQSRFSRDMEVIERYLHNKFTLWNVRFISIIDNADTENVGNKKARQINALVNEWFLEDLSDNIKATLRTKWYSGECTSSFAKYGLMKDPKNKNHLLIDPIASEVLKVIGNLFLAGYGQDKIARVLEEKKIPSPYEYKLMNGSKLKLPITKVEDKTSISRSGSYIIKFFLYNNYKQILKDIKSVFILGISELQNHHSLFSIKVKSISDDIELYYAKDNIFSDFASFNFDKVDLTSSSWKKLEIDDVIPSNTIYIVSRIKKLDRLLRIEFELEVNLSENKKHNIYKVFTKSQRIKDDIDISFDYEIRKKYQWNGRVIYQMLKDETYHGTLIQGKTKRISYKNHKCISAKREDWVVSENALEKIFDDETWTSIQNRFAKMERSGLDGTKHIFSGKVYCGECGSILHKNSSRNNNSTKIEYLLCKDKQNKWANCNNNKSIKLNILYNYVLKEANSLFEEYYDINILKKLYRESIDNNLFKGQELNFTKEKEEILSIISKKDKVFEKLYEDRALKLIDDDDFIMMLTKYKEETNKLKERINTIDDEIEKIKFRQNKIKDSDNFLLRYNHINKLTTGFVSEFIDRISIGKIDESTNFRVIKIIWNF